MSRILFCGYNKIDKYYYFDNDYNKKYVKEVKKQYFEKLRGILKWK